MRRLYIIPKSSKIGDYKLTALSLKCNEIVRGVPSILTKEIAENQLPLVYEIPTNQEGLTIKDKVLALEQKVDKLIQDRESANNIRP